MAPKKSAPKKSTAAVVAKIKKPAASKKKTPPPKKSSKAAKKAAPAKKKTTTTTSKKSGSAAKPANKKSTPAAAKAATKKSNTAVAAASSPKKKATPVKKSSTPAVTAAVTAAVNNNNNDEVINLFLALAAYEMKAGERPFASKAYRDAAAALQRFVSRGNDITCGSDVARLPGCGHATVNKIDEFLTTGKVKRLEELKDLLGDLPQNLINSMGGKSGKSGAGAASKSKSSGQIPTAAEAKKITDEYKNLMTKTVSELKEICKTNDQKVTGNKEELSERLAHQVVLGAVRRCPTCGGGRPRYNQRTGLLTCPGYMEDTDFIHCHAVFDNADGSLRQPFKWS